MPEERRKALDEFPQIVVDLSEETMQQNAFSRTQLQSVLGANKQALIARWPVSLSSLLQTANRTAYTGSQRTEEETRR